MAWHDIAEPNTVLVKSHTNICSCISTHLQYAVHNAHENPLPNWNVFSFSLHYESMAIFGFLSYSEIEFSICTVSATFMQIDQSHKEFIGP